MSLVLGLGYAALIIYLSNLSLLGIIQAQWVRWMLYGVCVLLAISGVTVAFESAAWIGVFVCFIGLLGAATGGLLIGHTETRNRLRACLPAQATYDTNSIVHTTALVMILIQVTTAIYSLHLAGGIEGLARDLAAAPPTIQQLLLDGGLNVLLALGGIGFYMRRDFAQSMQRLGLRLPTGVDMLAGAIAGVALFFVADQATVLWRAVTPPDLFESQTAAANALFNGFAQTPLLFVLLPLLSAVGEEVLYRGALQPVFGIVLTTLFFVLLHTQYLGTPAMLIILGIGLTFGLLRQRISTTAAVLAHFIYNLIPFLLLIAGTA